MRQTGNLLILKILKSPRCLCFETKQHGGKFSWTRSCDTDRDTDEKGDCKQSKIPRKI